MDTDKQRSGVAEGTPTHPAAPWAARDGQRGDRRPGVFPMDRDKKDRGSESPGQFISDHSGRSGYRERGIPYSPLFAGYGPLPPLHPRLARSTLALELYPGAG